MDSRQVGREREQPQGAVLLPDSQGARATGGKDNGVEAAGAGDGPDSRCEDGAAGGGGVGGAGDGPDSRCEDGAAGRGGVGCSGESAAQKTLRKRSNRTSNSRP